MTKGKYANRAENRRTDSAEAEVVRLRAELVAQRDSAAATIKDLSAQVLDLKTDVLGHANKLVSAEVARRIEAFHEERKMRGLSDDILKQHAMKQDRLMFNACRYLSMTKGYEPLKALDLVMTWVTDDDYFGAYDPVKLVIELGVMGGGWVDRTLRSIDRTWERGMTRRNKRRNTARAVALDHVAEIVEADPEGNGFEIHPKYNPKWYPRIKYYGMEPDGAMAETAGAA